MTSEQNGALGPGADVYTADGEHLGTVKELEGDSFKVDAPHELDYWLSNRSIASATAERVDLRFNSELLGEYKLGEPDEVAGTLAATDGSDLTAAPATLEAGERSGNTQSEALMSEDSAAP